MQNKTIAYLRVSTVEQDLEKNKADILTFANNRDFGKVKFVEEKVSGTKNWKNSKIKQVIDDLKQETGLLSQNSLDWEEACLRSWKCYQF